MSNKLSIFSGLRIFPLVLGSVLVFGCGGTVDSLNQSGTITIEPSDSMTWSIDLLGGAADCTTYDHVTALKISTYDSNGLLRGNVDIDVISSLSSNSGSGLADLFDDFNDDGFFNLATENVSDFGDPYPYSTKTGDDGTKTMYLLYMFDCVTYLGNVTVTSGSVTASESYNVTVTP